MVFRIYFFFRDIVMCKLGVVKDKDVLGRGNCVCKRYREIIGIVEI